MAVEKNRAGERVPVQLSFSPRTADLSLTVVFNQQFCEFETMLDLQDIKVVRQIISITYGEQHAVCLLQYWYESSQFSCKQKCSVAAFLMKNENNICRTPDTIHFFRLPL